MTERVYFHGGVSGLQVGDFILPPDLTGTEQRLSAYAAPDAKHGHRTDRVYVTPTQNVARFFAAVYPDGAIYRVEPVGDLEPDPDAPGDGLMCAQAQVVEVVRERVVFEHRTFDSWVRLLKASSS